MKYLIAHDIGTSADKATLFDTEGRLIKSVSEPYATRYFDGVCAEQDPEDWWTAVCRSTKALTAGIDPADVAAVSFSGQMQGLLCVDRQGQPLRPFIIWADVRAAKEAKELAGRIPARQLYTTTGHPLNSSYTLEKLMWVKAHEPDVYRCTYKILSAKDYIVLRMTGRYVMDYSNASATNAMDICSMNWSKDIIEAANVEGEMFPELTDAVAIAGEVDAKTAIETGLAPGTPVVVGGGDGQCASVGAGSVSEGKAYISMGSSAWISVASAKAVFDDAMTLTNFAHIVPGMVCPSGTMQTAGSALEWMRENIGDESTKAYTAMNELVESAKAGSQNLLFLPYMMGERAPRWNPDAKGTFVGLKLTHTRADMFRSTIEGIAMNLNVILQTLKKDIPITELGVIGGMAKGDIVCRILADVMETPIRRSKNMGEVSSMGAAVVAGVGAGLFRDFSAIERFTETDALFVPDEGNARVYNRLKPLFDEAYFALEGLFARLSEAGE
jgi:xylulokinase